MHRTALVLFALPLALSLPGCAESSELDRVDAHVGSPDAGPCLFGTDFAALLAGGGVTVVNDESLTGVDALFEPVQREQVVLALGGSPLGTVTSAEDAFARVDGGTIRRVALRDVDGVRSFFAFEATVGGASYGAVFPRGRAEVVARIDGGAIAGCGVAPERCLFGARAVELRESALFDLVARSEVTSESPPSAARAAQVVAAVAVTSPTVGDLASAFEAIDGMRAFVTELREVATARTFVMVEYDAGENRYGAVFEGESVTPAAEIRDGDLDQCAVFGGPSERPGRRAGSDCNAEPGFECADGLACTGIAPELGVGRCVPEGAIAGEGAACSASAACPSDDLVCSAGACIASWKRGSFEVPAPQEIPDDGVPLVADLGVYGLAPEVTLVVLRGEIEHPRAADVRITVTSPSGITDTLALDAPSTAFASEARANGAWIVQVFDDRPGEVGTVRRLVLEVSTR